MNAAIKTLLRIGLVAKRHDGTIRWPIYFAPSWVWRKGPREILSYARAHTTVGGTGFYVFRNPPGVVKWLPGRMLPRRWGFGFAGLIEFGDRG